jgi:hypothetical protein
MGRQIQIYLATRDIDLFEEALKQRGVVFVSRSSADGRVQVLQTCKRRVASGVRTSCYLARQKDLKSIRVNHISSKVGWVVDDLRSPVIQFDGGFFDGRTLRQGRLFYDTGYYNDSGEWVNKPADFLKWADSILKMAKKLIARDRVLDAYVGSHAGEWLARTGGHLEI